MSDRIELYGLHVLGVHGALPSEQDEPQPFEVDLEVETDCALPGESDDLTDALDYGLLVDRARSVVADGHFQLLEALAQAIAAAVLAEPKASKVTVVVRKLRPPVPADLKSAGVRITRRREAG